MKKRPAWDLPQDCARDELALQDRKRKNIKITDLKKKKKRQKETSRKQRWVLIQ